MRGTGDDGMMAREIGNVRFLIEQQIQVGDDLERRGLDGEFGHRLSFRHAKPLRFDSTAGGDSDDVRHVFSGWTGSSV